MFLCLFFIYTDSCCWGTCCNLDKIEQACNFGKELKKIMIADSFQISISVQKVQRCSTQLCLLLRNPVIFVVHNNRKNSENIVCCDFISCHGHNLCFCAFALQVGYGA